MIASPRPLPLRMDLVGLDLAQLPLLLPGLQRLACVHVVLVRVHLQQVLPLVEDHLVARYKHITSHHKYITPACVLLRKTRVHYVKDLMRMVAPVQGSEALEPLTVAFLVVFQEGPWVDVVGSGPEAWLFIAMALSVLRGVPVPARQETSTVNTPS